MVVGAIDFFLLGPLEARQRERPLRLGSIKHRMLLAKLLLHPNQVVSTEELIEAVWGEEPPPTVKQSLQNHVAALRKAIDASGRKIDLEVDGGVNPETARRCIKAGADVLVAGTAVFSGGPDRYAANIKALRS